MTYRYAAYIDPKLPLPVDVTNRRTYASVVGDNVFDVLEFVKRKKEDLNDKTLVIEHVDENGNVTKLSDGDFHIIDRCINWVVSRSDLTLQWLSLNSTMCDSRPVYEKIHGLSYAKHDNLDTFKRDLLEEKRLPNHPCAEVTFMFAKSVANMVVGNTTSIKALTVMTDVVDWVSNSAIRNGLPSGNPIVKACVYDNVNKEKLGYSTSCADASDVIDRLINDHPDVTGRNKSDYTILITKHVGPWEVGLCAAEVFELSSCCKHYGLNWRYDNT